LAAALIFFDFFDFRCEKTQQNQWSFEFSRGLISIKAWLTQA
jgi:hypothetical protein